MKLAPILKRIMSIWGLAVYFMFILTPLSQDELSLQHANAKPLQSLPPVPVIIIQNGVVDEGGESTLVEEAIQEPKEAEIVQNAPSAEPILEVAVDQIVPPALPATTPKQAPQQDDRRLIAGLVSALSSTGQEILKTRRTNSLEVSEPNLLSLPRVDVESDVINIPIVEGSWDLTELDHHVGILEGAGQHPGDDYSMVFAGHVTTRWPILGPFGRLKNFSLGDEVVYSDQENIYTYEISRFIYAHPSRVDLLFQERGDQIVLVTCNGYDLLSDSFSKRLVSYATLVSVEPKNGIEPEIESAVFR